MRVKYYFSHKISKNMLNKGGKLKVIEVSSLDLLQQPENWVKFENFSTMFCTLGSRVKYGKVKTQIF